MDMMRIVRAVVAFLLIVTAASLLAQVSSSSFSSGSTDQKLHLSCEDVSMSGTTLNGTCNKSGSPVTTNSTSIDLASYVVCTPNTHELTFTASFTANGGTGGTAVTASNSFAVETGSVGDMYYLTGTCDDSVGKVWLALALHIRNDVSQGVFEHVSTTIADWY